MSVNTMTDPMQDLGTLLLTGISNDVTLGEIAPKLPWSGGHLLRAVSNDWQRAFQSGMVYDARVHSQATEVFYLAVCSLNPESLDPKYKILLHSTNQDCWYKLPPIPGFASGLPYNCNCVPLNGKVYVLGGAKHLSDDSGIREVYMLDLAAQETEWKKCKCMQVPRLRFGVGVMDGKIFMIGGVSGGRLINRCEKYDPQVDLWSEIQPFKGGIHNGEPAMDIIENVLAIGKELILFGVQRGERVKAILRNGPSDEEAEDPLISENDDPSDDEVEMLCIGENKDRLISEDDSDDTLDDISWIQMIDPDLFRDRGSGDSQWFCVEIKKHGLHQIIEQWCWPYFNEAVQNGLLGGSDDMTDLICYIVYDTEEDKWRVVENLTTYHLGEYRLGDATPFAFIWPYFFYSELWRLNL